MDTAALAGALAEAGLAALSRDPVGTVAPLANIALSTGWQIDAKRWRGALEVLDESSQLINPEDLTQLVGDDPARLELLGRVMEAGARTTIPEKIPALARVLANGLQGDTVDTALMFAAALHDVEAPHLTLLLEFAQSTPTDAAQRRLPDDVLPVGSIEELRERLPGTAPVLEPLIAVLERHGLIRNARNFNAIKSWDCWTATGFGVDLLELLGVDVFGHVGDRTAEHDVPNPHD